MSSFGSSSWAGFTALRKYHLSLYVSRRLLLSSLSLLVSCIWLACCFTLSFPLLLSPVNKHPEPAPRRTGTVNRKQPPLTSPTFQSTLPPLETLGSTQHVPQSPQVQSPGPEAQQLGLSTAAATAAGVEAQGGGVQAAAVQLQVVTQLSTEDSR